LRIRRSQDLDRAYSSASVAAAEHGHSPCHDLAEQTNLTPLWRHALMDITSGCEVLAQPTRK
jgi:hypothetical protein